LPYLGFNVGALMSRRAALLAAGLFDESLRQSEDVDLFIRLREAGARHLVIPDTVLEYRRHQSSLTATAEPKALKHGAAENWIRLVRNSIARRRSSGAQASTQAADWPRVSVLLVVRDGRRYLPAALASIRAQTLAAAEIIAVVGASADGTAEYLQAQGDVRVVAQSGEGLATARNQAIAGARAPLLAFLDHDDLWHERKLEMQAKAIDLFAMPAACITNFRLVGETGSPDPTVVDRSGDALQRLGWTPSALLVHRDVFDRVGGFDPSLGMGCDTDWFRRLRLSATPIGVASQVLMEKRVHDNNLSRENAHNRQAMFRMLGKHRAELRAARLARGETPE
jgi:GT2 family glycosyltransferase